MPIRRRWLRPEITKGIPGQGPSLEVPPACFPVGSADPLAELLKQRAHGRLTIDGGQEFCPHSVQANERQVIIERGQPPFIGRVLIDHHIRHPPGAQGEHLLGQLERRLGDRGDLHDVTRSGPKISRCNPNQKPCQASAVSRAPAATFSRSLDVLTVFCTASISHAP